jgi:hypothetical protein
MQFEGSVFTYTCYTCKSEMRVQFSQKLLAYSKKRKRKELRNHCVMICCSVCSGRIAQKVDTDIQTTVAAT